MLLSSSKLDTLFDIGAPDATEEIMKCRILSVKKKQEDIDFYLDQKSERRAAMSGSDTIFESKAAAQLARRERIQSQKEKQVKQEDMVGLVGHVVSRQK